MCRLNGNLKRTYGPELSHQPAPIFPSTFVAEQLWPLNNESTHQEILVSEDAEGARTSTYRSTNGRRSFPERDSDRTRANDSTYMRVGEGRPRN